MDISQIIIGLLYGMVVSLGVGSSTLALTFYLLALRDGVIDEAERAHLGIVYVVLRVVMVLVLILLAVRTMIGGFFGEYIWFTWLLVGVLYGNATLMTLHKMSMKIGPALQASTWYALGISTLLLPLSFRFSIYAISYICFILISIIAIEIVRRFLIRN